MKLPSSPIVWRDPETGRFDVRVGAPSRARDTLTLTGPGIDVVVIDVESVAIASARTEMPGLIRASAESGRAFLIQNARDPSAASALLINPEILQDRLAGGKATRTLRALIDSLPFGQHGAARLTVDLPNDVASVLQIRETDGMRSAGQQQAAA